MYVRMYDGRACSQASFTCARVFLQSASKPRSLVLFGFGLQQDVPPSTRGVAADVDAPQLWSCKSIMSDRQQTGSQYEERKGIEFVIYIYIHARKFFGDFTQLLASNN